MTTIHPKIVSIGDITADLVMPVKMPVEPGKSQEMPWHSVEPGGAGNFLIAGQRLGAQMYTVGAVGDDLYGRHVLNVLHAEGVNVEGVAINPHITTTVVAVLFEPDAGKFTYVWHGGHGDPAPVGNHAMQVIDQADALFMQGFTLCEASLRPLVEHAMQSDKPIWYDVGPATRDVPDADRDVIRRRAHYLMTTEDELPLIAQDKTGQAAYDFLFAANPTLRLLIVKRGAHGCRVITPYGTSDVPGFTVTARDLIGAGDCFNAAFIYGTLRRLSAIDAATLANAMGAAMVQKLGTGRSAPTRDEVLAVLHAGGKSLAI
ncbi:MAG: carbohydrate kinase family protein [Anaerolineae bacterium]|nr:carbohydrate kinase family protein [Anaerolineae bacterium]